MFKLNPLVLVLSLSAAALLSACGGGGGGTTAPSLRGVAAVGAPIVGGDVDAKCSDGNTYNANPTSTNGAWSIAAVSTAAFPCVVQIRNGEPEVKLNSFAAAPGVVNITPFTDLILAIAAKGDPSDYFSNISEENKAELANEINSAIIKLKNALATKGYLTVGDSFDPINARFTATSGNFYDDLLEDFKQGLNDDGGKTYEDLLEGVLDDPSAELVLPPAPLKDAGGGSPVPGSDTVPAAINSKLVKTYSLKFKQGSGAGCGSNCSFVEDQVVEAIVGSDNSLTINGKKLKNPVNRILYASGSPHLPEIIWFDGNVEYALSDNELGNFNEINIGLSKSGGGIPSFIGQIRDASVTPKDDPIAKLKPFAESYAPEFVLKSGNFNLPSQGNIQKPPINTPFSAIISENGVVTLDGLTFDPEDSSYQFNDFSTRGNQLPSYTMSYRQDEKTRISLEIFFDDEEVVAWKVARETDNGGGSFGVSSVLLEQRPYPVPQQALFDNLVTASADGSELGIQLIALADGLGYMKCDQLALEVIKDTRLGQPYRYFLYKLTSDDRSKPVGNIDGYTSSLPFKPYAFPKDFDRRYMRYSNESMNETLLFQMESIVKRSDGYINYESSSTGALKGSATNDPIAISAASCPEIKPLPERAPI